LGHQRKINQNKTTVPQGKAHFVVTKMLGNTCFSLSGRVNSDCNIEK